MRSVISLALAGAIVVGCGGITPGQTIPPINIPSINLPSLPPFEIPSGIDIPSIGAPNPGGGLCRLLSAEEVSTAFGVSGMTVTRDK